MIGKWKTNFKVKFQGHLQMRLIFKVKCQGHWQIRVATFWIFVLKNTSCITKKHIKTFHIMAYFSMTGTQSTHCSACLFCGIFSCWISHYGDLTTVYTDPSPEIPTVHVLSYQLCPSFFTSSCMWEIACMQFNSTCYLCNKLLKEYIALIWCVHLSVIVCLLTSL